MEIQGGGGDKAELVLVLVLFHNFVEVNEKGNTKSNPSVHFLCFKNLMGNVASIFLYQQYYVIMVL